MKMKALKAIKDKVKTLNNKCHELTDEVLAKVTGGVSDARNTLDKYLKNILPDKSKILVDDSDGRKLELKNTIDIEDKDNVYIIKRRP